MKSPGGTAEWLFRPYGTLLFCWTKPTAEAVGYFQRNQVATKISLVMAAGRVESL